MPVDYSKWDKLELSDDEDFECHPNVDKASMVRWKQADIHKHRRERKDKLAALDREVAVNSRIISALKQIASEPAKPPAVLAKLGVLHRDCHTWTEELREQYMSSIWKERDARWGPPELEPFVDEARPKYGDLVEAVMQTVAGESEDAPEIRAVLHGATESAVKAIETRQSNIAAEVKREQEEAAKKLTADDLKEGFNKTVVSKTPSKAPAPSPVAAAKSSAKTKTIETIHQPGGLAQSTEEDDEEADHITYPPAQTFSELSDMEASFQMISKHPELVSQRYSDMILADGFRKELDGKPKLAQRCVTQALLLQYCSLLGHDGISLFFARLRSGRQNAAEMFNRDVVDTYKRIHERVKAIKAKQKEDEEAEQAELQARLEACTQPDGTLAIPITSESTEEEKKRAEVFGTFPHDFQRALLLSDVDAINAHLASLGSEKAQELVKVCNEAGLLSLEVEEDDEDNDQVKPTSAA
ncbi:hsp90 co-chaperone Cdc37 [Geranomyces michiganensis]|nr:hsp90 co-chaperone Cdc37 [Geranomyces michiganensis]